MSYVDEGQILEYLKDAPFLDSDIMAWSEDQKNDFLRWYMDQCSLGEKISIIGESMASNLFSDIAVLNPFEPGFLDELQQDIYSYLEDELRETILEMEHLL